MAGAAHIPVWTAKAGETLVVRPQGPCSVAICETLEAGLNRLADEQVREVCIDLSAADWLDSTFTGFLISLLRRSKRGDRSIALIAPSEAARKCLDKMHVLELFPIRERLDPAPTEWQELPRVEPDACSTADRVIEAHQQLIAADARNEPQFAPVVELFRKRQQKECD